MWQVWEVAQDEKARLQALLDKERANFKRQAEDAVEQLQVHGECHRQGIVMHD